MSLPTAYFDEMYERAADPWGLATRWYETRKYKLTLACLPRPRFRRAFEPGCSVGVLTEQLAGRCDELLSTDVVDTALVAARQRLAGQPHVDLRRLSVPAEWPTGRFDLIVVSELGYYLSEADLDSLVRRSAESLDDDGVLVAVHWRHPVADYPLRGDAVHQAFRAVPGLDLLAHHEEADFLIDVLTPAPARSVAEVEELVAVDRSASGR